MCRSCRSKSFPTSICMQKSASIQPRTSPPKFQISFPPRQFNFISVSHRANTSSLKVTDGTQLLRPLRKLRALAAAPTSQITGPSSRRPGRCPRPCAPRGKWWSLPLLLFCGEILSGALVFRSSCPIFSERSCTPMMGTETHSIFFAHSARTRSKKRNEHCRGSKAFGRIFERERAL